MAPGSARARSTCSASTTRQASGSSSSPGSPGSTSSSRPRLLRRSSGRHDPPPLAFVPRVRKRPLSPIALAVAVILSVTVLLPLSAPGEHAAAAQSLGEGLTVTGDFTGSGHAQIASLYDQNDDLALKIAVLDKTPGADTFTSA